MTEKNIEKIGLSESQAFIYIFLLKNGEQTARKIHQKSPFKRGLVYKGLNELIGLGLVQKKEPEGKVTTFLPLHPLKLKELAEKKEAEAKDAQLAISSLLPNLISDFNFSFGAPGVSFYRGIEGVEKIHEDILRSKKDLMLFRSPYDNDSVELSSLVKNQIKKQARLGIRTLAITPIDLDLLEKFVSSLDTDESRLATRRMVNKDSFILNSEIFIYGSKTALVSLKNDIVATIIDNQDITDSFKTIFQLMWNLLEPEHQKILQKISKIKNSQSA